MLHAAGMAGVLIYAWWATGRRPFTATAALAVVGVGVAAIAVAQAGRSQRDTRPTLAGATGWLLLVVALAGWQLPRTSKGRGRSTRR